MIDLATRRSRGKSQLTWVGVCVQKSVKENLLGRRLYKLPIDVVERITFTLQFFPFVDFYTIDPIHGKNPLRRESFNSLNPDLGDY